MLERTRDRARVAHVNRVAPDRQQAPRARFVGPQSSEGTSASVRNLSTYFRTITGGLRLNLRPDQLLARILSHAAVTASCEFRL